MAQLQLRTPNAHNRRLFEGSRTALFILYSKLVSPELSRRI
jgi:hypothetical protein